MRSATSVKLSTSQNKILGYIISMKIQSQTCVNNRVKCQNCLKKFFYNIIKNLFFYELFIELQKVASFSYGFYRLFGATLTAES